MPRPWIPHASRFPCPGQVFQSTDLSSRSRLAVHATRNRYNRLRCHHVRAYRRKTHYILAFHNNIQRIAPYLYHVQGSHVPIQPSYSSVPLLSIKNPAVLVRHQTLIPFLHSPVRDRKSTRLNSSHVSI